MKLFPRTPGVCRVCGKPVDDSEPDTYEGRTGAHVLCGLEYVQDETAKAAVLLIAASTISILAGVAALFLL